MSKHTRTSRRTRTSSTCRDHLASLEDKIAYGRQFYNDTVLKYNNRIMQVPTNIIAGMFHFQPAQYFAADEADRSVPQVKF